MKMEEVQDALRHWGEILATTSAGETYELHLGDTSFDFDRRIIRLKSPEAEYLIGGDEIASVTMHYGRRMEAH
nr:MAG: hypothetical protein DIU70_02385 [Bacillota bacterium]